MIYENFYHTFKLVKELLGFVGVTIISVGALYSMLQLKKAVQSNSSPRRYRSIRESFACFIVLGLEFMLASDIVMTVMAPDYYTLGILGGLVIIRTVLTISLDKEAAHAEK